MVETISIQLTREEANAVAHALRRQADAYEEKTLTALERGKEDLADRMDEKGKRLENVASRIEIARFRAWEKAEQDEWARTAPRDNYRIGQGGGRGRRI